MFLPMDRSASGSTGDLLARNDEVSRNLCASLGGDLTRVQGLLACPEDRTMQIGRVGGCCTVPRVIVCQDSDITYPAHAQRHERERNSHR